MKNKLIHAAISAALAATGATPRAPTDTDTQLIQGRTTSKQQTAPVAPAVAADALPVSPVRRMSRTRRVGPKSRRRLSNGAKARIRLSGHTPAAWARGDKNCWPNMNEAARVELLTTTPNLNVPSRDLERIARAEAKREWRSDKLDYVWNGSRK